MCGKSPPFSWRKTTTTGSNNKKQDGEFQSRISSRPAPTPPLYGLCVIFTSGCNKHTKTNKKVTQGRLHYLFLNGFRRASCCCCCDSFGFRALQINTLAVGPVKEHWSGRSSFGRWTLARPHASKEKEVGVIQNLKRQQPWSRGRLHGKVTRCAPTSAVELCNEFVDISKRRKLRCAAVAIATPVDCIITDIRWYESHLGRQLMAAQIVNGHPKDCDERSRDSLDCFSPVDRCTGPSFGADDVRGR